MKIEDLKFATLVMIKNKYTMKISQNILVGWGNDGGFLNTNCWITLFIYTSSILDMIDGLNKMFFQFVSKDLHIIQIYYIGKKSYLF